MDIIEVKDTNCFKKIPIGIGTSAICYKINNNMVAKLFYKSFCYDFFINEKQIQEKFELLSIISNDTFIGPEKIIVKDGVCVGYIYPYIEAKTLKRKSNIITVEQILKYYDKIEIDTKKISDKNFNLRDLHDKNILFNKKFSIIDLDRGGLENYYSKDKIYQININKINRTIINSLYHVKEYENIKFLNDKINELYNQAVYSDNKKIYDFLEQTLIETKQTNHVKYKKIVKKINYTKHNTGYYNL